MNLLRNQVAIQARELICIGGPGGADDAVYMADDDGKNFDGPWNYAHVLKITGIPPNHQVETVTFLIDICTNYCIPKNNVKIN
ncbi:MAG: hypothetical protein ABIR06_14265 [Cyclobacteriaceae bacterium]